MKIFFINNLGAGFADNIDVSALDLRQETQEVSRHYLVAAYLGWIDMVGVGGGIATILTASGVAGKEAVLIGAILGIMSWAFRAKLAPDDH